MPQKAKSGGKKQEKKEEWKPSKNDIIKIRYYFRVGCHFSNEPTEIVMNAPTLKPEDIKPDDPLFKENFKDHVIGNMPELTSILQDEEILERFQNPDTGKMMIEIGKDTKNVYKYLENEDIKFFIKKIDDQIDKVSKETRGRRFLDRDRAERKERRLKEGWPACYIREYSPPPPPPEPKPSTSSS